MSGNQLDLVENWMSDNDARGTFSEKEELRFKLEGTSGHGVRVHVWRAIISYSGCASSNAMAFMRSWRCTERY